MRTQAAPASVSGVFAEMVDKIVRHNPAAAGKRLKSPDQPLFSAGRTLPMRRECKARKVGKYRANGLALSARTLFRGLQNIIRNFECGPHQSRC